MPATRSRTSTEQPAEIATEEVKHQEEPTEPVVSPPVEQEQVEPEAPVSESAETPVVEESQPEAVAVPENGTATEVQAENGTTEESIEAEGAEAQAAVVEPVTDKRKSEVVGDGDGPDSTELVAKKPKVDEEEVTPDDVAEAAPVEASA